jgi:hypothetical protein
MFIGGSQQFATLENDGHITTLPLAHVTVPVIIEAQQGAEMARNGFRIFDADTHVRPDADLLMPYLAASAREKLAQYEKYQARNKDGAVTYWFGFWFKPGTGAVNGFPTRRPSGN